MDGLYLIVIGVISVTMLAVGVKISRTPDNVYEKREKKYFVFDKKSKKFLFFKKQSEEVINEILN